MHEKVNARGVYVVSWIYKHNHRINTPDYFHKSRLKKEMADKIRVMIQQQIPNREIMDYLLIPLYIAGRQLDINNPSKSAKAFKKYYPQTLEVCSYHLKNMRAQFFNTHIRKGKTLIASLDWWAKHISKIEKGWCILKNKYEMVNSSGHNVFSFQFSFGVQVKLMKNNIKLMGIDSTHGIVTSLDNDAPASLFVLMGIDPVSGRSLPLSFMVTNYNGIVTIQDWLRNVQKNFNINPLQIVLDCDQAEISSLGAVFPNARLVLCSFHILRAFEHKLKDYVKISDPNERKEVHKKIKDDFKKILFNPEGRYEDVDKFVDKYSDYERFITYFKNQWKSKVSMWLSTKENPIDQTLTTNNLTENFFSLIKNVYLRNLKDERIDTLLYCLSTRVIPNYWKSKMLNNINILKYNKRKREIFEEIAAYDLDELLIKSLIEMKVVHNEEVFFVRSLDLLEEFYEVRIDYAEKTSSCTCKKFVLPKSHCRHSHMVFRFILLYKEYFSRRIEIIGIVDIELLLEEEINPLLGQKIGNQITKEISIDLKMKTNGENNLHEILNQALETHRLFVEGNSVNTSVRSESETESSISQILPQEITNELLEENDECDQRPNNNEDNNQEDNDEPRNYFTGEGNDYDALLDHYVNDPVGFARQRDEQIQSIFEEFNTQYEDNQEQIHTVEHSRNEIQNPTLRADVNGSPLPIRPNNNLPSLPGRLADNGMSLSLDSPPFLSPPPSLNLPVAAPSKRKRDNANQLVANIDEAIADGKKAFDTLSEMSEQLRAKALESKVKEKDVLELLAQGKFLLTRALSITTGQKNLAHNNKSQKKRKLY